MSYKTTIHKIDNGQTVTFSDKQSGDRVDVEFKLDYGEEGFYSEEYRPTCCDKHTKRIDITCGVKETLDCSIRWYLYEVKTSLTGEDKIKDVFEQFEAGYYYLKNGLLKDASKSSGRFGVFTGKYDEKVLKRKISASKAKLAVVKEGKNLPLGQGMLKKDIKKVKLEIKTMTDLLKKEFIYTETGERFTIDIQIMNKVNGQNIGTLIVQYK